jgi:hypothetical protein
VHDLTIDGRADASGKSIETLERRCRAFVTANEVFGDLVELARRDAGANGAAQVLDRRSENLPSLRHELDLAIRLELNHLPSARKTR